MQANQTGCLGPEMVFLAREVRNSGAKDAGRITRQRGLILGKVHYSVDASLLYVPDRKEAVQRFTRANVTFSTPLPTYNYAGFLVQERKLTTACSPITSWRRPKHQVVSYSQSARVRSAGLLHYHHSGCLSLQPSPSTHRDAFPLHHGLGQASS